MVVYVKLLKQIFYLKTTFPTQKFVKNDYEQTVSHKPYSHKNVYSHKSDYKALRAKVVTTNLKN